MTDLASQRTIADPASQAAARVALDARPAGRSLAHGRWWRDALRRRLLATADVLAASLGTFAATVPATGSLWPFVFLPIWPLLAKILGLYDRDHRALRHTTPDEVPGILAWGAISAALVSLLVSLTPAGTLDELAIGALFLVATVAAITLRSLTRWAWWRLTPAELVGLVGDGAALDSVRRKIFLFREMHLELAIERRIDELGTGAVRNRELRTLIESSERIVVAATGAERELIGELKSLCRAHAVKLSVVSPLRGKALPSEPLPRLADLPILEYNTWDPARSTLILKRTFDVIVSAVGLIVTAPALAAIALAIKLDSPGPVFFSQVRAGLGGRPFRIYKLRTMSADAEGRLDGLVDIGQLDEPAFKLRDDPRVTRVGRFLRRFSIDEVPQLINVLVGEMSLVGPRPEQVELVERYSDEDRFRLAVKPGITGPMQIFGRGDLTFSERVAVELDYVENPTLATDLRIMIHTLPAVMRGTGAY